VAIRNNERNEWVASIDIPDNSTAVAMSTSTEAVRPYNFYNLKKNVSETGIKLVLLLDV
jgi:hypothetical protein